MTTLPRPKSTVQAEWESVQARFADIPGERGIARRADAYRGHFLRFGRDVRIFEGCRFYLPDRIALDDDVRINIGAIIYGSGGVRIGRHARIGPRLFLHSANHEVDPNDERAFFERGYVMDAVTIGDNCLISANVSILPGARIGPGVFIAAGAVVSKGDYPDSARIVGVPGRVTVPSFESSPAEAPIVAMIVPDSGGVGCAAKLLVESLGLPQVRVFGVSASLPDSVRAVLAFDAINSEVQSCGSLSIWNMDETVSEADASRKLVPGSLLARWISMKAILPDADAGPASSVHRRNQLREVEAQWLTALRTILHEAGFPMVRLLPWPHGYDAALSLRFNLKRSASAQQMLEIIRIQRRLLNGACGSWFASPERQFGDRVTTLLPMHLQETGLHLAHLDGDVAGRGVTWAAAEQSDCAASWLDCLERGHALYGDLPWSVAQTPSRTWIGDLNGGRTSALSLLPLAIPLNEHTTSRLAECARHGEHAMIDVVAQTDAEALASSLREVAADQFWCVPLDLALARCRQILGYGSISVTAGTGNQEVKLISRHTLADVEVEIDLPDGDSKSMCLQLNAHVPRRVL